MPSLILRGRVRPRVRRPAYRPERNPLQQHWRKVFFQALAETSNVARACEQADIAPATVYDLKRRDVDFAERWLAALAEGYDNLEMELLDRLRNGETGDARYNYAVAVRALQAHRAAAGHERGRRASEDAAASRASILKKLEQMREQVLAQAESERQDAERDDAKRDDHAGA